MPQARRALIYSPLAEADLLDIWAYIAADNTSAADGVLRRIDERLHLLSEFPYAAKFDDRFGAHLLPVPPYIVAYRLGVETIEIIRVIDGRRDLERIFPSI